MEEGFRISEDAEDNVRLRHVKMCSTSFGQTGYLSLSLNDKRHLEKAEQPIRRFMVADFLQQVHELFKYISMLDSLMNAVRLLPPWLLR